MRRETVRAGVRMAHSAPGPPPSPEEGLLALAWPLCRHPARQRSLPPAGTWPHGLEDGLGLAAPVARSSHREQKAAGGSPLALQPHRQQRWARRQCGAGPHCPFSFFLPFLWPVSSSSFLSSLLCSCALLAGSRDLSLAPLPA